MPNMKHYRISALIMSILFISLVWIMTSDFTNIKLTFKSTSLAYQKDNCKNHVPLCWLRSVLTKKFNFSLPNELYDMSSVYKFATYIFLQEQMSYHVVHKYEDVVMQSIIDEALLKGLRYPIPHSEKNTDLYGRNCEYDHHTEYRYIMRKRMVKDNVHIYITEIRLVKGINGKYMPNDVTGIIKTKSTTSTCMLVSYISDIYHVVCPIMESDFKIFLSVNYITITTSTYVCARPSILNIQPIVSEDFLNHKHHSIDSSQNLETFGKNLKVCKNSNGHSNGFWLVIQSVPYWATKQCYYPFNIDIEKLHCLEKKRVLFLGDSHMKGQYEGFQSAYNPSKGTLILENQEPSLKVLASLLITYKEIQNGNSLDALVFNTGVHDFTKLDIVTYIATMGEIFKVIKMISNLEKPPKIIWAETMPMHPTGFHGKMMTNQLVEAANDWANHHMKALGVKVVHGFDIAKAVTSEKGDDHHFITDLGSKAKEFQKAGVGGTITSVIMNFICPDV